MERMYFPVSFLMNDEKMMINGMTTTLFCGDKPWQGLEDLFLFVFMALCGFGHILMRMECMYFPVSFFMNDEKMLILKQLLTTAR